MFNVGQMIKEKREAAGLSLEKLQDACGVSDGEIMKIEKDEDKTPNWESLCKIAQALNFHPFEILLAAGYITEKDTNPVSITLKTDNTKKKPKHLWENSVDRNEKSWDKIKRAKKAIEKVIPNRERIEWLNFGLTAVTQ